MNAEQFGQLRLREWPWDDKLGIPKGPVGLASHCRRTGMKFDMRRGSPKAMVEEYGYWCAVGTSL